MNAATAWVKAAGDDAGRATSPDCHDILSHVAHALHCLKELRDEQLMIRSSQFIFERSSAISGWFSVSLPVLVQRGVRRS